MLSNKSALSTLLGLIQVRSYFERRFASSPIVFAIILGFVTVPLVAVCSELLDYTHIQILLSDTSEVTQAQMTAAFVGSVFIGPPIETALSQLLIIEMIGTSTKLRRTCALWISALLFGALHIFTGGLNAAISLTVLGLALSSVYIGARPKGLSTTFSATLATHVTHNFLICALIFFFPAIA